ncbi:MAG TPA: C2 family cysteine protease [Phycisphaerae bacterium]
MTPAPVETPSGGGLPVLLSGIARLTGASTGFNAPSNLIGIGTTSYVSLTWNDRSTNETGFNVYSSTDGSNFSLLASVGENIASYKDYAAVSGITYTYRVAAFNGSGQSGFTNSASAGLVAVVPPPAIPGNFAVAATTTSTVSLSWNDVLGENGYHIYRSTDAANYAVVANLAPGITTFTDSNLAAGTHYYYMVGAWNASGESSTGLAISTASPPAPPLTITTPARTGFTELRIDGTSGNDSILVTQSGSTLTVTANGQSTSYTGPFGDLVIHGASGNDTITVDTSVTIPSLVYSDAGSDTIRDFTTGKATIVTIGGGISNLTGNGINTAFWANPTDIINASVAEIALGGVNRVSSFYQPWSSNPANPDYVPLTLSGQNLRDPTDSGTTERLTANSFWGLGPTMNDINQTVLSDCYFLAPLASLAQTEPARLMNMGVDLGDGTYAVRFVRNGVTSFVRVDGDIAAGGWSWGVAFVVPGVDGNLWGSIFEKAYAFFRNGQNTYASLNFGYQSTTFFDLGLSNTAISASSGDSTILTLINFQLSSGHAMAANTYSSIIGGAPLIASHVYSVIGAFLQAGTVMIQLRNPWGIDGAGNDGLNDGIVTIPYAQFAANFNNLTYTMV